MHDNEMKDLDAFNSVYTINNIDSCGNGYISKIIASEDTAECSSPKLSEHATCEKILQKSYAYNFSA